MTMPTLRILSGVCVCVCVCVIAFAFVFVFVFICVRECRLCVCQYSGVNACLLVRARVCGYGGWVSVSAPKRTA